MAYGISHHKIEALGMAKEAWQCIPLSVLF